MKNVLISFVVIFMLLNSILLGAVENMHAITLIDRGCYSEAIRKIESYDRDIWQEGIEWMYMLAYFGLENYDKCFDNFKIVDEANDITNGDFYQPYGIISNYKLGNLSYEKTENKLIDLLIETNRSINVRGMVYLFLIENESFEKVDRYFINDLIEEPNDVELVNLNCLYNLKLNKPYDFINEWVDFDNIFSYENSPYSTHPLINKRIKISVDNLNDEVVKAIYYYIEELKDKSRGIIIEEFGSIKAAVTKISEYENLLSDEAFSILQELLDY